MSAISRTSAAGSAICKAQYPQDFKVFYSNKITTDIAQSLRFEDDTLLLDEKSVIHAQTIKLADGKLDLRSSVPGTDCKTAALVTAIYAETPGKFRIGMGVDWWFDCYCNGKFIYATPPSGNGVWPPAVDNYVFDLPLRAGRNELVIFTKSGIGSWDLVIGEPPEDADVNIYKAQRVEAKVMYGPYITNPGTTTLTISYVVQGRQPLELEYRKKGNKIWKKMQILRGGQLLDEGPVMRFDLSNLTPATTYEYRAIKRAGHDLRTLEADEIRTFKTFSDKAQNFSFYLLGDTHLPKQAKLKRVKELLKSRPELTKADMFVHLGDFNSYLDDIELEVFESFLKHIPSHQHIVTLRGNHEFDGCQAGRYLKYLGSREQRSYQSFKLGDIFFIALDTGHHLPENSDNSFQKYAGLNELDTLLEEQTAWLKEVVNSEDFRTAKYRIVMGHIAPHSQLDEFNHILPRLHKMTQTLFKGNPAKYPIDLWLAGHKHKYNVAQADKFWQFPVITLGGGVKNFVPGAALSVNVKNNQIFIESIDSDGKTNSQFVLDKSGKHPKLQVIK